MQKGCIERSECIIKNIRMISIKYKESDLEMIENKSQEGRPDKSEKFAAGEILLQIKDTMEAENQCLKKQLNTMRLMMAILVASFLILLFSFGTLVPKASHTLEQANDIIAQADKAVKQISKTMLQADEVFSSVQSMVEESEESLTLTIEEISKIDFHGLNKSIEDLGSVVSPLAGFFERFR